MRRKMVSLENLSEQKVSWLHYIAHNKTQLRTDPNVELLLKYLRDISPFVLTAREYNIFWNITDNRENTIDIAIKFNVTKNSVYKQYERACKKLKPLAKVFITTMKIKNISEV